MSGGKALLRLAHGSLQMKPVGAVRESPGRAADPLPGKVNYFRGSDSIRWRTNVPTCAAVKFEQIYSGIDLIYHGNNGQARI